LTDDGNNGTMQITFLGNKSILKTYWEQGLMPTVTNGLYGARLTKSNVSLEHIQPRSKRGHTCLANLALASKDNNYNRNNHPLSEFLTREQADNYLKQFTGIRLPDFNGDAYIKKVDETIRRCFRKNL
jgi:hypothetical protein